MGKIKKGVQKVLHKEEIKARKLLKSKLEGTYYLQIDNSSNSGVKYVNTIAKHRFGIIQYTPLWNDGWETLVRLAIANLVAKVGA